MMGLPVRSPVKRDDAPAGYYLYEACGRQFSIVDFSTTMKNFENGNLKVFKGWEAILIEGDQLVLDVILRGKTWAELEKEINKYIGK